MCLMATNKAEKKTHTKQNQNIERKKKKQIQ